jgi:hypothetical protein
MAQFTLPKNSKVTAGKTWPTPAKLHGSLTEVRVYRWNPDDGQNRTSISTRLIAATVDRWCSTHWSGSRTPSIRR